MFGHLEIVEDRKLELFQVRCMHSQPGIARGNDVRKVFDSDMAVIENVGSELLARLKVSYCRIRPLP